MKSKGIFVVIDGPNGVGKTTVINELEREIKNIGIKYILTKEPTNSKLGQFIRANQDIYKNEILACLIAANRYEHINSLIIPKLDEGYLVISDRYLPSSLVYQSIDNLDKDFIMSINKNIIIPDLTVILTASIETLVDRISKRSEITRFEATELKAIEVDKYEQAYQFLLDSDYNIVKIDNDFNTINIIVKKIVLEISKII